MSRRRTVIQGVLLAALAACGGTPGAAVHVTIPKGASFRVAADSLSRNGLIAMPGLFSTYASLRGRDKQLRAGTYVLRKGMSWTDLLDALSLGRGLVRSITVPEGWSLSQILPQLGRVLQLPAESLEVAAADTALRRELDVPTPTLEGYLFPDTYVFPEGTTARAAVGRMVQEFVSRWKPEWNARLGVLAMSRNDIMALAAIIEKEARLPEERPVISAVYHNRLKRGMLLQADPTVQFALGRHVERVLFRDLTIDSRYNTYKYKGLPPGPVASPGLPSIEAALFPANVPFLYFVAHPDGHHEFRRTFAEHAAAVRQMRRLTAALKAREAADSVARNPRRR